jgi:hypothetical protein
MGSYGKLTGPNNSLELAMAMIFDRGRQGDGYEYAVSLKHG